MIIYTFVVVSLYLLMYKRDRGQPRVWARPDLEANLYYRSQTR